MLEDPGHLEVSKLYENPGSYEVPGLYEDLKFRKGKTQGLIN